MEIDPNAPPRILKKRGRKKKIVPVAEITEEKTQFPNMMKEENTIENEIIEEEKEEEEHFRKLKKIKVDEEKDRSVTSYEEIIDEFEEEKQLESVDL